MKKEIKCLRYKGIMETRSKINRIILDHADFILKNYTNKLWYYLDDDISNFILIQDKFKSIEIPLSIIRVYIFVDLFKEYYYEKYKNNIGLFENYVNFIKNQTSEELLKVVNDITQFYKENENENL